MALLDGEGVALIGGDHPLIDADGLKPLLGNHAFFTQKIGDFQVKGAVAPVPYTDWTVVIAEPSSLAQLPATEIREQTFKVLLFSMLLAMGAGMFFARSISNPVAALRESALAVASGKFGQQTTITRTDELGDLAKAFNHMSDRLLQNQEEIHQQQEEIETFNNELQERVDVRTKELMDAQAQLVRAGQLAAVAEVGAGLAHELNNPVAAILGWVQVLRAQENLTEDDTVLHQIENEASRCREVVAAMLRVSSGELDPKLQPVVDLRDVLREVFGLVHGPFRQRGVGLTMTETETSLMVRVDPVHGSRIFAQILNALRAGMTKGTSLAVISTKTDGKISVRFQSSDPVKSTDDWMASGMGLWVARQLLSQLGGKLIEPSEHGTAPAWTVVLPGV
jgi:C4-dicarboxylate-specific signal transduction histidine kinase